MKRIGILLGTALLVALPVVGQDDANTKLKQRIDELVRDLEARKTNAPKRGEFVEQRIYDLSDLIYWSRPEFWYRNVPMITGDEFDGEPDVEPVCPIEIDHVIEIVRSTVHPSSWDNLEGADLMPTGRKLIVNTIPSVHRGIAACLATLRRAFGTTVGVEVVAIAMNEKIQAVLDAHVGALPEAVAKELWARPRIGSLRTFGAMGLPKSGRQGRTLDYIAGYEVSAMGAAAVGVPRRHMLFDGCQAVVRAHAANDGKHVLVDVTVERTHTGFGKTAELGHGPIQLPVQGVVRVGGSVWLASGSTAVIGGGSRDGEGCVFLVRATVRR